MHVQLNVSCINSRPIKLIYSQNKHLLLQKGYWHRIPELTCNCILSLCTADAEWYLTMAALVKASYTGTPSM